MSKRKEEIRQQVAGFFEYNLFRSLEGIRPTYSFDVSYRGSVPEALICFLDSSDYEDAVRKAVSLGGDSDTQACIAGAVAHGFYGQLPADIVRTTRKLLPPDLLKITEAFCACYHIS
ncbi:MAG: ADP-ribosylglycohydrolase family protein [Thermodesulfobacteriota bacterium]